MVWGNSRDWLTNYSNGEYIVDKILKFEDIFSPVQTQKTQDELCSVGIQHAIHSIHLNKDGIEESRLPEFSKLLKNFTLTEMYSVRSQKLVANRFKEEIYLFNYTINY
jgi:hypothetical protein